MEGKENRGGHYKAHVLLFPFPLQGHINPILQFSKRLASKGVKATVATTVHVSKSMHSHPTNNNLVQIETISDGYDHGGYAAAESDEAYLTSFQQFGSRTLANLINKLADIGDPVNSLVYDSTLPWALDVAKQFGLFKIAFFTQTCAVSNVYYHVNRGLLELPLSGPVVSLPGLPPLGRSDVPSFLNDLHSYPAIFDSVVGQYSNVDEADWVLHNTFYELEPQVVDWMAKRWRLRTIGPMVPSMYLDKRIQDDTQYGISLFKPNTTTCKNWLSEKPRGSVVYVSLGSLAALDREQMQEMACALKGCGYNFLWVVREAEQGKLPDKFIEETAEKGLVVTWCQQLDVLANESIGCFVTHCGLSSTLEALSLGVKIVAIPQWTDQCTNAKFIEDVWETGIRAWPDKNGVLRRGEVEQRIREVMEGEKRKVIEKNARKWRSLAREAMEQGGSSDNNIEELVAHLVCL